MAQRILPRVTYQPPEQGGEEEKKNPRQPQSLYGDAVSASEQFGPFLNQMANSLYGGLNQAGNYLFGGEPGKRAYPENPKVGQGFNTATGQTPPGWQPTMPGAGVGAGGGPTVSYNPFQGIYDWLNQTGNSMASGLGFGADTQARTPPGWTPTMPGGDPVGQTPPGWSPGVPSGAAGDGTRPTTDATGKTPAGWVPTVPSNAPADAQTQAARLQDAVTKNQNLTQQAKDTGNEKELARLQAEWDRIAPMAQKYGITPDRLINSYMQPGNPAAESSLERAMGKAIADDTWANAAQIAFGRPPNQLEWDEHWRAMNKGGRDPLEGHPQSIQLIQQRMQEIQQENQNQAFGQYQAWLANQ